MKLISFAAISLLAITVSAYPGLGTPPQGAEQSQSTDTQGLEEPQSTTTQILPEDPRQSLQNELDELDKEYKVKQDEADKLQSDINDLKEEKSSIKSRIVELDRLDESDEPDESDEFNKANLLQHLSNLQISLDKVKESRRILKIEMKATMEYYSGMVRAITALDETPEWLIDYNVEIDEVYPLDDSLYLNET
ncbi:hypothetical protein BASA50_003102 [Batrachochytrium salamandrivorans]|uniref:Uncharacterized protein n=1 Tax=Batrachochytrium salamandrivorans TaxID=1357716 RepID=A0ABQ8FKQ4_9FUNG|nr:hypothetical protein BASA50_003102 [Batrachochytrium salamandrivorans]KAH9249986.1 hypothetical protein BASA81_012234 [Batrachochytrium salamandrivorans]KAJ1332184.1 hypothetical protein BSLG_009000 [Batrachochytrium salamandrivorans]